MNRYQRAGAFFNRVVGILSAVLMALVLYATIFLDKTVKQPFPNTTAFSNGGYYLFAVLLAAVLLRLFYRLPFHMPRRTFYISLILLAALTAAAQYVVAQWLPVEELGSDFQHILETAEAVAQGKAVEDTYFQIYPNNLNFSFLCAWLYAQWGDWHAVCFAGALLTNASVILAALSVYHVTKRESAALLTAVWGEVLAALTWRAFLIYTDCFGMFFAALILWLYTLDVKMTIRFPLLGLAAVCGSFIKPTVSILVIAAVLHAGVVWLRQGHGLPNWKSLFLCGACLLLLYSGLSAVQDSLRTENGFEPGEYPRGLAYFFMLGQNTKSLGCYNISDGILHNALVKEYRDPALVNQAMVDTAWERIQDRGWAGNLDFYIKKLNVMYNDGYFHNVQSPAVAELPDSFLSRLYVRGGAYYQTGVFVLQLLWDTLLLILSAAILFRREKQKPVFFQIVILGVTLYQFLFECRSKYLYMFLPVYLAAFGVLFHEAVLSAAQVRNGAGGTGRVREKAYPHTVSLLTTRASRRLKPRSVSIFPKRETWTDSASALLSDEPAGPTEREKKKRRRMRKRKK